MGVKVALFAWGFKTEKVENLEKEKKYCVRTWKDSKVRNLGVILLEHKKGPGINYCILNAAIPPCRERNSFEQL